MKDQEKYMNGRGRHFGYESYCDEPDGKYEFDNYKFIDNDESIYEHNRPCPKCGDKETIEGHDPCIRNLPGVRYACCGHGFEEGYILFENGIIIRGNFKVSKSKHWFKGD
ncbi:MAG: hypothetical protein WC055_00195 [Melioribacteraceae bacterium]